MKQRKRGEKRQNWHRPLGRSQLGQRFIRHRHDQPEQHQPEAIWAWQDVDEFWDPSEPYCSSCGGTCFYSPDSHEIDDWRLGRSVREITRRPRVELPPSFAGASYPENASRITRRTITGQGHAIGLEDRLAAFVETLPRVSRNSSALEAQITPSIGHWRNIDVVRLVADRAGNTHLAERICLFAPFWVRRPRAVEEQDAQRLLKHVFVLYEAPEFLYAEWSREGGFLGGLKWLCWLILLGQGGSLTRAAEIFGWEVPSRFVQHLAGAPADATTIQACIFAEVKRLGGAEVDFRRVLRNPAFTIDPTEPTQDSSYPEFWRATVRWIIDQRRAITDEECDLILTWAMHEYTEGERARRRRFSWKGRSLRGVLRRSAEHRREMERPWAPYRWQGHGWNWELDESPHGRWSFVELTSGEALFRESSAMGHCVASYAGRCASGHSAIMSIRRQGERRLTVEVNPHTRHVMQVRGAFNRPADTQEQQIVDLWVRTVLQPDTSAGARRAGPPRQD